VTDLPDDTIDPADPLPPGRRAVVHGAGVRAVPTLPALLCGVELAPPSGPGGAEADVVLAWGMKPSAERAAAWAASRGLPLCRIEDGFMRSVELGADEPPLALVVDGDGIYYDARRPSRLESLARLPETHDRVARARALQHRWRQARVSKYNAARERPDLLAPGEVLLIDQTAGDASIRCGLADGGSFQRMVEAALDEHPGAGIVLKVHPDVLAGRKQGHVDRLTRGQAARVRVVAAAAHPPSWLEQAAAVYTVTSQMGFEALLWGRPVRCFGMPFYAGWGLTSDALPAPERRAVGCGLPALVHAALIDYARYVHPETGERCELEPLLDWMGLQRVQRERFAPQVHAVGFSRWKQPIVQAYFAGSTVRFARPTDPVPAGAVLALWGMAKAPSARGAKPAAVVRLEDGFLRSVGLGGDLVRPLSWVMDTVGMYYDASSPSGLERLLATHVFDDALRQRARALRERLCALQLTKYNTGRGTWTRPTGAARVVLVVGQVELDAAVRHGAPGVHTNLALLKAVRACRPADCVVYKPHPDVVARLRASGRGEHDAARWCDAVLPDVPMGALLAQVDEVHVLSSLAGFEALLRGLPVVTWGCPFYAGWGLTEDREPLARRSRRLMLDELVAATLLLYPTYVSRSTGRFTTAERVAEELLAWREAGGAPRLPAWRRIWRVALRAARWVRERPLRRESGTRDDDLSPG